LRGLGRAFRKWEVICEILSGVGWCWVGYSRDEMARRRADA
jgi:hypothetical protein